MKEYIMITKQSLGWSFSQGPKNKTMQVIVHQNFESKWLVTFSTYYYKVTVNTLIS